MTLTRAEPRPPFTSPATYAPYQSRPLELPIGAALDLHLMLANQHGHPRALFCDCPLAQALQVALRWGKR